MCVYGVRVCMELVRMCVGGWVGGMCGVVCVYFCFCSSIICCLASSVSSMLRNLALEERKRSVMDITGLVNQQVALPSFGDTPPVKSPISRLIGGASRKWKEHGNQVQSLTRVPGSPQECPRASDWIASPPTVPFPLPSTDREVRKGH